jgi:hypothetical protein
MLTPAASVADAVRMSPSRQTASPPRPQAQARRVSLGDGAATTLRVARFPRDRFTLRLAVMTPPRRLLDWCSASGVPDAMIGGFYVRSDGTPLGELRIGGRAQPSRPFEAPWDAVRACVHALDGDVSLHSRLELGDEPGGDLLQAGPMLVRRGVVLTEPGSDPEGFSAGRGQFDSDITAGRYPRAALGLSRSELIAVVCEGRADGEAGLTLAELARAMVGLGADDAINLDGGGSTSLVIGGELLNTPREEHGMELPGGREICTALRFVPR